MLDRTIAPPVHPLEPAVLLPAVEHRLSHNIPAYVISAGDQPVLKVEWIFKAGKSLEEAPGAAYFLAHMLKSGTQELTAHQIAEYLAQFGASLSVTTHLDYSSLTLHTLTKFAPQLLPWVTRLIWESTLPVEELETQRDKKRQSLQIDLQKTSYLGSVALRQNIFGTNHAYGQSLSLDQVDALTKEDLHKHHLKYHRNSIMLVLSGQVTDEHLSLLSNALQNAPEGEAPTPTPLGDIPSPSQQQIVKEGVQATLRIGQITIPKTHPDFHKLRIANELYGGYFGARLMQNIREDKGLTYGIYSTIAHLEMASYLTIGADVKKENVDLALQEIKNEMSRLQVELVPAEELERVKAHLAGKFMQQISSPFAQADVFKALHFFNLDQSYYQDLFDTIQNFSTQDLLETAAQYLNWDNMSIVIAGA